jgi:hypothetical protein
MVIKVVASASFPFSSEVFTAAMAEVAPERMRRSVLRACARYWRNPRGRSWAPRAASSVTTGTPPGLAPEHRQAETPATLAPSAGEQTPMPPDCDCHVVCPDDQQLAGNVPQRVREENNCGCEWLPEIAEGKNSTNSLEPRLLGVLRFMLETGREPMLWRAAANSEVEAPHRCCRYSNLASRMQALTDWRLDISEDNRLKIHCKP